MRDERTNDTKKQMCDHAAEDGRMFPAGGESDIRLDAEEILALYSFVDRHLQARASVDEMIDESELCLHSVRCKLAQRIKISMRVAAAVVELRRSDSLTAQIARGLSGAKEKAERYMNGQREKIVALKEGQADVNNMAAQLRPAHINKIVVGSPLPDDDAMVEVDLDPFQEEHVRDYPRRRPPAPIMPRVSGRRRAKRHGGSTKAV